MRLLIVEDELRLSALLRRGLTEVGHSVDSVATGQEGIDFAEFTSYDAIILDVMLPDIDGFEICRLLRKRGDHTPILLLTARDAIADRVEGLDAGADDYVVKPFSLAELAARIRALTRRPRKVTDAILQVGDIRLDPATHRVWKGAEEVTLPNKEFSILEQFMRNPNRVLTRAMIADHVWNYDIFNVTNVVDVHILSLRRKLNDPYPGGAIQTVRGVGYRLIDSK
jgi:two-component system OmpR family response regulator